MELKINRNDPCPCKSGKKYKKCHGSMEEIEDITNPNIPLQSVFERRIKAGHLKQCIHPNQENCSGNIVKAHSIQNNRILKQVGRNGEIYMVKSVITAQSFRLKFKLIGRKVATTFTGFCGFHDKMLFQPIEDTDYVGSKQQQFLFAYRVFSFEYHKKMEAQNTSKKRLDDKPSLVKNKRYMASLEGYDLAIRDNTRHKEIFDQALLNQHYDIVETVSFSLECTAILAACSGFFLEYDLNGKKVNHLGDSRNEMKLLMVNIFPNGTSTVVLFSWLKEHSSTYNEFKEQLLGLKTEEVIQLLNNLIPSYSENVVYSPYFIDNWNENEKKNYLQVFQQSINNPVEKSKRNLLGRTSYNLFQPTIY